MLSKQSPTPSENVTRDVAATQLQLRRLGILRKRRATFFFRNSKKLYKDRLKDYPPSTTTTVFIHDMNWRILSPSNGTINILFLL